MFRGSRPRGSSRTPVSGKIGRMSGSPAPPRCSLISGLSGKHDRGEPAAAVQRQRISRTHHLEKFEELLARGLLVPFANALEEGQQFVDGRFPFPAPEQRSGEFEATLVVVGVLRQAGA